MPEIIPEIEEVEHNGEIYYRIDPDTVDVTKMTPVQKVTPVLAFQVKQGRIRIITDHNGDTETINFAEVGDWVVFNLATSDFHEMSQKLLYCKKKVIKQEDFHKLYSAEEYQVKLSPTDKAILHDVIKKMNEDNSDFSDYNFVEETTEHKYTGKTVFVCRVSFNFVIKASWGFDQFVKTGGMIVFNPNTSTEVKRDIYGIDGAKNRQSGDFEKNYQLKSDDNQKKGVIDDTFKNVIKSDKSPIAGIQTTMPLLQKAFERIGKKHTLDYLKDGHKGGKEKHSHGGEKNRDHLKNENKNKSHSEHGSGL
jgi:hypothetical protein